MTIEQFVKETKVVPLAELTSIAADRRAFGDDIIAAFRTQVELRSTSAQTVLDTASQAGRDTLLASEQRGYDGAVRERDSILSLQQAVERRTESRAFVPATQTSTETHVEPVPAVLGREQRCVEWLQRRGGYQYAGERGVEQASAWRVLAALATGDRRSLSDFERRALAEGADGTGGYAVPEVFGAQILDAVLNRAVVRAAGAQIVPMSTDALNLVRVAQPGLTDTATPVAGAVPVWKSESDPITEGTLTLERIRLVARTLPMLLTMSVELSEDAVGLDAAIERAMSAQIALELDRAALNGSGTPPEPKGVLHQTDVTVDATAVVIPTAGSYDFMLDALGTLWGANHDATGIVYGPAIAVALAKLKDQQDQPLRAPDVVASVPKFRTLQATGSQVFYGDWSQLLIGMRTGFRLEVSRVAGDAFSKMQVVIRAYLRADVAVARPEAFVVQTAVSATAS